MIDQYLQAKRSGGRFVGRPGSPRTIEAYREALSRAERLLGITLNEVDERDADTLMQEMEQLAPATKAHTLSALRGYYRWAIGTGVYQGSNPFEGIVSARINRPLPQIFSKDEVKQLIAALPNQKYRLFFSLMYYGGLRIGEVTRIEQSDLRNEGVTVRGKGNKQRFVPLPPRLYFELYQYMRKNPGKYLFSGRNPEKEMDHTHAYALLERAMNEVGVSGRAHNLRHTSATHFHMASGDLARTQTFLGHASPVTTMVYVQVANEAIRETAARAFGD